MKKRALKIRTLAALTIVLFAGVLPVHGQYGGTGGYSVPTIPYVPSEWQKCVDAYLAANYAVEQSSVQAGIGGVFTGVIGLLTVAVAQVVAP